MPLIMVGQNLQSRHGEVRAENDLEVNVRAEREIEAILRHLEYQNTMLIAMDAVGAIHRDTHIADSHCRTKAVRIYSR